MFYSNPFTFVGYKNNSFFLPYKSLHFERYATVGQRSAKMALCLFPDSHIFNYHNYGHPTSLAFKLFWVYHYYLFIYNYNPVNSFSCLQ